MESSKWQQSSRVNFFIFINFFIFYKKLFYRSELQISRIQYRIAKRGVELLAIGGRMVYSTCSLNPIENEAVLHRLLTETGDSVQLVDCKNLVPGLVFNQGNIKL